MSKSVWYDAKTGRATPSVRTWENMRALLTKSPETSGTDWDRLYTAAAPARASSDHAPPIAPAAHPARISNLPPRLLTFTGRDDLLDDLFNGFRNGGAAIIALHGLGGIGKSQSALEYAHRWSTEYAVLG